jgi:outer membrane protein OmpA-like peptidoglycan-associated protein
MVLWIASAMAQVTGGAPPEANAQLFRPTVDGTHTLWADDSGQAPDGWFGARGLFQYTRNPVIWTSGSGEVTRVVGDLVQLNLMTAYQKGPVRLGVDVPLYLRSIGDDGGESGLGDVALDTKVTLTDRRKVPVGAALTARASVPTATVEGPLGNRGFAWEVAGVGDIEVGDLLVAANLGVRGVPRAELENFVWGAQAIARIGGGYRINDESGASIDLGTHLNLAEVSGNTTPLEALVGGWYQVEDFVLRAGIGTGLTGGFGSPQLRTIFSVAYEPPRMLDADSDDIADDEDQCPDDAEDLDGFADFDGCPEPTMVRILVNDTQGQPIDATFTIAAPAEKTGRAGVDIPLDEREYTVSIAAKGYVGLDDLTLRVPGGERYEAMFVLEEARLPGVLSVRATDPAGAVVESATWSVRNDDSGAHAGSESVELEPGTYQVRVTAEGYGSRGAEITLERGEEETLEITLTPLRVRILGKTIALGDDVVFEDDAVSEASEAMLAEVAALLNEHPEITSLRIEGHSDGSGSERSQKTRSLERAKLVRKSLVKSGVAEDRLVAEGIGAARPIAVGDGRETPSARIELHIVETAPPE